MHPFNRDRFAGIGFCLVLISGFSSAFAADHFLAIGGGDSPANNQISLESNVLFFERLVADAQGKSVLPDVLFSDGKGGTRDVQFDETDNAPRVNILLSRLFNWEADINSRFRPHQLPGLRGPSTRRGLEQWFNTAGKSLGDGDRLLIYFTGHGGSGNPAQNTTISMWCERPMSVTEFTALLDKLSPKVRVVLVMVQCHSGGFASVIFNGGKASSDLSPAHRCGFFATRYDRLAAGCTPDTHEADYRDYSTYFFAALDGKTRTGKEMPSCDLNGDGKVSFAEAHAYTLVHSDTIDLPTTTSEAMVRQFMRGEGTDYVPATPPFKELLATATPPQKAVLQGLSDVLNLSEDDRMAEVKHLADVVESQRRTAQADQKRKSDEAERVAVRIRERLLRRWPELANPWNARGIELITSDAAKIQEAVDRDSENPTWDLARRDAEKLESHASDLERKWIKCQRLVRMLDTVALSAAMEKNAPPSVTDRYHELISDEAGFMKPR